MQYPTSILLCCSRKIFLAAATLLIIFFFSLLLNNPNMMKYPTLEASYDPLSQTSSELTDRIDLLNRICEEHKATVESTSMKVFKLKTIFEIPLKSDILVDRQRDFFWCKVPKAASTSWAELFLSARKRATNNRGLTHTTLRRLMPRPKSLLELRNIQTKSFSFMTVRHPFDRLLSAYRDKFFRLDNSSEEDTKATKFYTLYGSSIIKTYRKEPPQNIMYNNVPTFKEFVSYLLETSVATYNEHWLPYFLLCTPCHVQYNIIGKTETINEDSREIMERLKEHGVSLTNQEEASLQHTHKTGNRSTTSSSEIYFSQIPNRMVQSLHNRYLLDFLMFGYDIEPYLSYASPSNP